MKASGARIPLRPGGHRIVPGAARVALFLNRNAAWMRAQRYFMGTVLGLLALKLLTEKKAAA